MNSGLFKLTLERKNEGRPPVWLMRQAGRYHSHYQALRKRYSFIELCKIPEASCEATLGPIQDFGFDAAILFSDLLFPLEAMGMGLRYEEGPKLDWHLQTTADLNRLAGGGALVEKLAFQGDAMRLIRSKLSPEKGLLGFVGGPLTLFCYAVEGSHQGGLNSSREGLRDGRFEGFLERLMELLAQNMALQARAGADTVAVLDTCAGEFDPQTYAKLIVPSLNAVLERFKSLCPETPITYYSKGTGPEHWKALRELPISCLGVDWKQDLPSVLREWGPRWVIQGNFDPQLMHRESGELEKLLRSYFGDIKAQGRAVYRNWVSGLGHGVLPKTPEDNVKLFVKLQHEYFGGDA